MKVLFVNVPFIKHDKNGQISTGPNAGSRWPWTMPGPSFHDYAPYPFYMANAVTWLRHHDIESDMYDGVAEKHSDIQTVINRIIEYRPSIVVFDVSTPVYSLICNVARIVKREIESIVVFAGPHMKAYVDDVISQPFVDHAIIGEYEIPILDIVKKYPNGDSIYRYQFVDDINELPNGGNFVPYRDNTRLGPYYDPSMKTPRIQLQVSASRGCPFKCTYCQWPNTLNGGRYRPRSSDNVIAEIQNMKDQLGGSLGSIFFDDDTWNLGNTRISKMCDGLKALGVCWTMMGRIDTSNTEIFDKMVESGCKGMRFGIESFNQQLLDNAKKNLDAKVTYNNIKYLLTNNSGMEFHFTTMKNLPGSVPSDWENDKKILQDLISIGGDNGNVVHYQNSDCIPFPGTELWEELVELGHGDSLKDFNMYDGHPSNDALLAKTIGWLGAGYAPKRSKYSGDGTPTGLPTD